MNPLLPFGVANALLASSSVPFRVYALTSLVAEAPYELSRKAGPTCRVPPFLAPAPRGPSPRPSQRAPESPRAPASAELGCFSALRGAGAAGGPAEPTPATHAILAQLKAGETVYQAGELPKTH